MADLSVELANLNVNARELLQKYNGAFARLENLSEEKRNEIIALAQEKLQELQEAEGNIDIEAIKQELQSSIDEKLQEFSQTGTVANALKLDGKSLEEIKQPDFDSGWITPTLGCDAKLILNHNLGKLPFVRVFVKITLVGDYDSNLYNENDILEVPVNAKDGGAELNATGMYGTISTNQIKLFFYTYVGAKRNCAMNNGYIQIKQIRVFAWKGVSL